MESSLIPPDHVIVVFGANGDLSRRKLLPALFHLADEGLMPKDYRIVGSSRSQMSDDEFRNFARDAVEEFCRRKPSAEIWADFQRKLSYVSSEFRPGNTDALKRAVDDAEAELGDNNMRLFYLAVPQAAFAEITEGISKSGLSQGARVVFEKPFGNDVESFKALDEVVHHALDDDQVYRIDHFLGKETVQNILALRFANGIFEPIWNHLYIDHVQIDVPEEIGIGTRASFYEQTGALRDMLVTHLLQVLSFVALEPPPHLEPKPLMDEVAKVFESILPLDPANVVYGQYEGYREEPGVAPDSSTETFVAARLAVENWRWTGVPFYLRTGKFMAQQNSSVTLAFKRPPHQMFAEVDEDDFHTDHLTLGLGPEEGITLRFMAKAPGPKILLDDALMKFRYEGSFGSDLIEAYERLLHDAMLGDRTLFTRADGIARTWEIVTPLLDDPPPVQSYPKGSWGPEAANDLIAPRHWHFPDRLEADRKG